VIRSHPGAAYARRLDREDIAIKFDKTAMLYRSALRMGGDRQQPANRAAPRTPRAPAPAAEHTKAVQK
jgi:hypothetical protein